MCSSCSRALHNNWSLMSMKIELASVSGNSLHAQGILGLEVHLCHRSILRVVGLPLRHHQMSCPADICMQNKFCGVIVLVTSDGTSNYDAVNMDEHTQTLKSFGALSKLPFGDRSFGICSRVTPVITTANFSWGIRKMWFKASVLWPCSWQLNKFCA